MTGRIMASDSSATNRKAPAKVNGAKQIGADGRQAGPDDGRDHAARQHQRDRLGPECIVGDLGRGEAQMQRRGVGSAHDRIADAEQDEAVLINRGHAERTAGRADRAPMKKALRRPIRRIRCATGMVAAIVTTN